MSIAAALTISLALGAGDAAPVRLPGSAMHGPRVEWRPEKWHRRRGGLIAGVSVSVATVVSGVLALTLPPALNPGADGTSLIGSIIFGPTLITTGTVATTITATVLAHHLRWDRPRADGRYPDPGGRWAARRARKQLRIALAVFASLAAAGGTSIGLGYAAAAGGSCRLQDACTNRAWGVGYGIGGPLIATGALGSLSSAILLGMHRSHRHDRAPTIAPGVGTIAIRF